MKPKFQIRLRPGTAERLRAEHAARRADRHADLIARLRDAASRDPEGEHGIYAEMLAEAIANKENA